MSLVQPPSFTYDLNAATDGKLSIILDDTHSEHSETLSNLGLIKKSVVWKDRAYMLLKYDKTALHDDMRSTSGLFRSVIASGGKILSFAPPKSLDYSFYCKQPNAWDNTVIEEFIEGTMMNLFNVEGEWEMATRSMIGANSRFFNNGGKETFRSMFLEAAGLTGPSLGGDQGGSLFSLLNPKYVYSFVFQHPHNEIVTKVTEPRLFLIRVYEVHDNGKVTEYYPESEEFSELCNGFSYCHLNYPIPDTKENYSDFDEVKAKWSSMNNLHTEMGAILRSPITGFRTKLRNPTYEMVRHLRGNQPKLQYHYLELRKLGKVGDYLKHFPSAHEDFWKYREQLHLFTRTLYTNYRDCFVAKTKVLKDFPYQFKPHMYNLHQKFLNELREKSGYIDFHAVVNYVNGLPPAVLLYALNWHLRKNLHKNAGENIEEVN